MAIPEQYRKEYAYLMEQSNKGVLTNKNAIYQKLMEKSKNLPELKRAMDQLRVNYV